jgi:Ni/Co efflux regulator RcnB
MQRVSSMCSRALIIALVGVLADGPALAEKPSWAGGEKGAKGQRNEQGEGRDGSQGKGDADKRAAVQYFGDQHRVAVREYYDGKYKSGRCPPGLAKKHNGCMPPGQAKKWSIGRPLPRNVIFYEVPQPLIVQIGLPPPGHRYVRVAADILLIAIGTAMVVDAIQDLGM